ncbi:MAG: hypothetical protein ACREQN_13265, partial [Candidatus Binataceae bacterium]
ILAGGKKSWRPPRNITTEEFSSLVALIETRHAAIVGPMLCAYGSCRVSHDADQSSADDAQVEDQVQDQE